MGTNPACQTFIPQLSPYVDGELKPVDRQHVERHLQVCKDCASRSADLRAESGLIRVGLDMAADEVDFKDFSQRVLAHLTPYRPPLGERLRVSLSETFLYQRRPLMASCATAALVALVALPVLLQRGPPTGYASERLAVEAVTTDQADVAPVVMKTEQGDAIIWLVDHRNQALPRAPANGDEEPKPKPEDDGDEDVTGNLKGGLDQTKPRGGEL